jgi:CubicO group peptidase (beta-lactamase class C family)
MATATTELQGLLDELAKKHKVPGANLAILEGDEVTATAATGVTSTSTGVEVTPDAVFQIGSISKVYTTTLIMQLVDEGKVDLDAPVTTYLPDLRFADDNATKTVTVRHLVTHTSGVDGDHFVDTGRGDDCVEKYVATCKDVPQVNTPGKVFSYCNTGFVVAGRLLEVLLGKSWDAILRERLLDPIGASETMTLPEESILRRAAVGHIDPTMSGELSPTPNFLLPRSAGPAGLITATPSDVLKFARLHLDGGVAPDGTRVLSEASVRAMQERQVDVPDKSMADGWGLGWILYNYGGQNIIGHDGGTIGQLAFLRLLPDADAALCLLTNGMTGGALFRDVFNEVFADRAGAEVTPVPEPGSSVQFDASKIAGRYERVGVNIQIDEDGGDLFASVEMTGATAAFAPKLERIPLVPVNETVFLLKTPMSETPSSVVFFDYDDSGRPRYLHTGGRASAHV